MRPYALLTALLLGTSLLAQTPDAFNYQGVARDASGDELVNTAIGVQFQLHQGTAVGTVVYSETHGPTTNELGLFSLEVGNGTPGAGTFAAIDWSAGPYFLEVGMDPAGGSSYSSVGTQQLLSVPYALHARTADMADDGDWVLSGDTVHSNGRRVGIGTNAPSQDLDVEGTFQLKDGTQGDKKILTSDAEGNASWELVTPGGLFGTGGLPLPPVDPEPCPRLSGTIGVGVDPRQVKTANDRVFVVSEGSDELFVVNVMDPDAPVMEGTLFMGPGSDPNALAHSGNHLYVLCEGSDELKVVDIADPSVPVLKGTLGIGTFPVSIVVENDLAYVVDFGSNDLKVIDVSDPDLPALLGSTVVGPSPGSVAVSGGYAFISKLGAGELVVVDISDPSMPALTSGVLSLGPGPISSAISGSYLYVVDYSSQDLKVIDVSSPLSPALSTSVPLGMSPNTVVVSGSYAYVTDQGSDDIKVFDISVPTAPALGIGFPLGTDPVSCAISGSFAYVVDQGADELVIVQLECVLNIDTDSTTYSPIYDPYTGELTLVEGWQVSDDTLYTLGKAVGIGTSFPFGLDPEAELAIVDTTGDAGLALGAHGVAASLTAHADTVSAGLRIGTLSGHPMMFGTAGTAWMKLDTSGQLGIRTMSPMLPLDVRGNGQVGNLDGTEDGYFMIRSDGAPSSTTTSGLRLTSSSGGGCATWGELVLSQDPQGGSASSASRLSFSLRDDQCSPPIERMVIAHNGHVGIGTTTPSAMLDVDGTIRFRNGSEAPGKLLVSDADGNATWSSVTGSGLFPSYFQPASIPADFSCLSQSAMLDVGTQASAIEVFDDHAYVLTPLQDLKVFNISDPGSPTLVTQRSVPGVTWWVHASGDLLLVTTTSAGFTLFDISDRDAPVSLGQFNNGGHYRSIGVSGDHAVCLVEVSGATDRLELVNVSDPTNPVLASSLTIGGIPWAMALTNDLACYVDQGTDQMKVVDISDPSTPVMKGSAPIGIVSTAIAAHDDLVYVVSNGNGLEIFDISDPNSPVLLGSADLWSDPNSIELVDHYAVIVDAVSDELSVVDVQNPMAPVVVNTMGVGSQPESVGIQGNHAYVVDYVNFDLRSIQLTCPTLATYNAFADEFGSTPIGDLDITENETDPVYSAWDKSSGISITESQVSDLQHFTTADETDPQVGSITTGYVPRWSGTELVTGSVFDNGNVGIGTSAPTRRFQVHDSNGGTIRPAVKIKVNNCGSPCTQPETTQAFTLQNTNGTAGNAVGIGFADNDQDEVPSAWIGARLANKTLHYGDLLFHTRGGAGFGERMRINSVGNVGIGTTAPEYTLHISNGANTGSGSFGRGLKITDATPRIYFEESDAAVNEKVMFLEKISDGISFSSVIDNASTFLHQHILFVKGSNSVGIGTAAPTAKLSVNGTANNSTGSWGVFSDARIKTEQRLFTDGLSVIDRLRPVVFTYNADAPFEAEGEQVGIIAQELEELAPYMVSTTEHGDIHDLREVNNQAYTFLLINAVQELNAKVNALQLENADLRKNDADLRDQLEANSRVLADVQRLLDAQTSR